MGVSLRLLYLIFDRLLNWLLRRCCVGDEDDASSLWRRCSDGKGEFGEDHREPAAGLGIEAEFVVSAAQVLDERMSATDHLGAAEPLQTSHRTSPGLQPAMISFDRVVGVLLHDVPRLGHELVEHRGYAGARSVVTSVGRRAPLSARAKNWRVAARSRFGEARTSMTCPCWSIARYRYTHCPATFR